MGNLFSQFFPPRAQWSPAQIPDLSGKVVLITGATSGIGKETAKHLLAHNAKVYIAARSKEKVDVTIAELKRETGKEALFLDLELSDLVSVKRAAETFLGQERVLNIFIANAGVMGPPIEQLTKQGYDLQFGTNVLGHWYLTKLLLPALRAGVDEGGARAVTISSSGADMASPINWEAFTDGPARRKMAPQELYVQSKLFNAIASHEFATRYADTGVIFSALNPGNIMTDLARNWNAFQRFLVKILVYDIAHGALTSLYAATAPEASLNGAYYIPWARHGKLTHKAQNAAEGQRFWDWAEEQVAKL